LSYEPTPAQALLLFGVLAAHGERPQAELKPAIKAADREALVKARLVTVAKVGRGLVVSLSDQGWAWAGGHLSAELPPNYRIVADLLARIGEYAARKGDTLADVIGPKPEPPPAPEKPANARKPKTSPKPPKSKLPGKPAAPVDLRPRIEAAYLIVTEGRRDRAAPLARLRRELADIPRETLDATLLAILKGGQPKMSLMRHDDPRQLSEADHEAAFNPSGEPFHVLWIAS